MHYVAFFPFFNFFFIKLHQIQKSEDIWISMWDDYLFSSLFQYLTLACSPLLRIGTTFLYSYLYYLGGVIEADHRNCVGEGQFSVIPPLLASIKKILNTFKSQLRALATLRPIWGRVGQGAFELCLPQLGSAIF